MELPKDVDRGSGGTTCYPPGHPYGEIIRELAAMSGLVLWRVTGTWANRGRTGEIDAVVEARNAIEAVRIAWGPEDPNDLRTVSVEWLCPIESVKRE